MDRQKFDRLLLEHLPAIQRFAIRLSCSADEADELVQESLLKASRAWQGFRADAAFRTWFFRIVIHAFRDSIAARNKRATGNFIDEPPDASTETPLAMASAAELSEAIARAVSTLPPRQREVLVLHVYERVADADIAMMLGLNQQNVRTTLHLARRRLRHLLRHFLPETDTGS